MNFASRACALAALGVIAGGCASSSEPAESRSESQEVSIAIAGAYPLALGAEGGESLAVGAAALACFDTLVCGAVVVTAVAVVGTVAWLTLRPAHVGEVDLTTARRIRIPPWLKGRDSCPAITRSDWLSLLDARYEACRAGGGGAACEGRTYDEAVYLVHRYNICREHDGGSACGSIVWATAEVEMPAVPAHERQGLNAGAQALLGELDALHSPALSAYECREAHGENPKPVSNLWLSARAMLGTARSNGGPLARVVDAATSALKNFTPSGTCASEEGAAARAMLDALCAFYNILRPIQPKGPNGAVATSRATLEAAFAAANFECRE